MASYPTSVVTYTTKIDGQVIEPSHINDVQAEIVAIAGGLLNGLAHDLKFTDATYDIGKSGATRPRDGFFSRNVVVGGTLGVTGVATFTAVPITTTGLVIGAVDTSSIRLDLESGTLAVREGDDSAYGPLKALTLEATGDITIGGGDLIASANLTIRLNTSDASDNGSIRMVGGGAQGASRGSDISVFGNEHGSLAGRVEVQLGNVANNYFIVRDGSANAVLSILGTDGSATFTSSGTDGAWVMNGTDTSANLRIKDGGVDRIYLGYNTSNEGVLLAQTWPTTGSAANAWVGDADALRRSTSSARYKENIRPSNAGLALLLQLRPIEFNGLQDKPGSSGEKWTHYGFLAEDVAEVMPNLVGYEKVDGEWLPGWIEYDYLTAPIVKAIQELYTIIQEMKNAGN